jgi:hypothetical protein
VEAKEPAQAIYGMDKREAQNDLGRNATLYPRRVLRIIATSKEEGDEGE